MDNSIGSFSRSAPLTPMLIAAAVVELFLTIGLVAAILSKFWLAALLFAVCIVGTAVISWFAYRSSLASAVPDRIGWNTSIAEMQRESLNYEVIELSRILQVETGQISDLQSAYIMAEDLALRQIQQEEDVPLMRHVTVGGSAFDSVFVKNGVLVCIDVSFLVSPEIRQEKIDAMLRKTASVKANLERTGSRTKTRLMMVLITQLVAEDNAKLRKMLNTSRFADTAVDIDIRLLDFEALQKIYVTD